MFLRRPPEAEFTRFRELLAKSAPEQAENVISRELFGRLCTAAMLTSVEEACAEWRPDLVLCDTCEYSSVVAAERRGIPHAQAAFGGVAGGGSAEGNVVMPGPGDAPRIRQALESVLADGTYRRAAQGLAVEMNGLPTVGDLLDSLESELVGGR